MCGTRIAHGIDENCIEKFSQYLMGIDQMRDVGYRWEDIIEIL
jgi:hypothetical protein